MPEETIATEDAVLDTPVPAEPTGPDFNELRSTLPAEIQVNPTIANTKSLESMAQQLINAQSEIGGRVKIPGQDATPEEKIAFWTKLGRPESPSGYTVPAENMPEGFDPDNPMTKSFADEAHRIGLPPQQFAALTRWHAEYVQQAMSDRETAQAEARVDAEAVLKKEWGQAYDERVRMANELFKTQVSEDEAKVWHEKGWSNDPVFVRFLAKMGKLISEDEIIGGGGRQGFAMTPEEAHRQIGVLQRDPDFSKAYTSNRDPGHARAVDEMERLHKAAYPQE